MKKLYVKPEMDVQEFAAEDMIMHGSVVINGAEGGSNEQVGGDDPFAGE
jgi:hypothetical protein